MDTSLVLSGAVAGLMIGYVFQRCDLCFHSTWRGVLEHRYHLFKIWLLGVAVGSVGLSILYGADRWALNEGLPLRPQGNVLGGLVIGVGMVVAASCTSGLFYKVGSGMLGGCVGLAAWAAGDTVGSRTLVGRGGGLNLRGERVDLDGGPTIPGVLGVDRTAAAVVFLVLVAVALSRTQRDTAVGVQWSWIVGGPALGAATTGAWVLAGAGGTSFGPGTVGGAASVVNEGAVNQWLVAFLVAIVLGALVAARVSETFWPRGENNMRYLRLAVGGLLLGIGGQIGAGCNLGHGLSGAAQLNVSSWLVVASIVAGIAGARAVQLRWRRGATTEWRVVAAD